MEIVTKLLIKLKLGRVSNSFLLPGIITTRNIPPINSKWKVAIGSLNSTRPNTMELISYTVCSRSDDYLGTFTRGDNGVCWSIECWCILNKRKLIQIYQITCKSSNRWPGGSRCNNPRIVGEFYWFFRFSQDFYAFPYNCMRIVDL
jgi:hypothetical protein